MAGRLRGTTCGRPVEIIADERDVLVQLFSLRTAWRARSGVDAAAPVLRLVRHAGLRLRVGVGLGITVRIAPRPRLVLRWLFPALRAV